MREIWNPSLSSRLQQVCSLVAEMASVLDLHSSPAVLEAAARTYLSLCGEGTAWCSVVSAARDSLVESWMEHLKDLLKDSLSVRATNPQVDLLWFESLVKCPCIIIFFVLGRWFLCWWRKVRRHRNNHKETQNFPQVMDVFHNPLSSPSSLLQFVISAWYLLLLLHVAAAVMTSVDGICLTCCLLSCLRRSSAEERPLRLSRLHERPQRPPVLLFCQFDSLFLNSDSWGGAAVLVVNPALVSQQKQWTFNLQSELPGISFFLSSF